MRYFRANELEVKVTFARKYGSENIALSQLSAPDPLRKFQESHELSCLEYPLNPLVKLSRVKISSLSRVTNNIKNFFLPSPEIRLRWSSLIWHLKKNHELISILLLTSKAVYPPSFSLWLSVYLEHKQLCYPSPRPNLTTADSKQFLHFQNNKIAPDSSRKTKWFPNQD